MTYKVEFLEEFYDWLIITVQNNYKLIKGKEYSCFFNDYEEIINQLMDIKKSIKDNLKIQAFNTDSINRLKIIIAATKKEYFIISDIKEFEKDIIYFNSLIGWYEFTIQETDMFINSLFEKQK